MSWRLKRRVKIARRMQDALEGVLHREVRRKYKGDLMLPLEAHALADRRPWLSKSWTNYTCA